jgi:hypothetical protein
MQWTNTTAPWTEWADVMPGPSHLGASQVNMPSHAPNGLQYKPNQKEERNGAAEVIDRGKHAVAAQ